MDDSRQRYAASSAAADAGEDGGGGGGDPVPAAQMAASFASAPECEPYILPLFPAEESAAMGHNVTWLCKALGSKDMALSWRLPTGKVEDFRIKTRLLPHHDFFLCI